jgi:hypothetical protein
MNASMLARVDLACAESMSHIRESHSQITHGMS